METLATAIAEKCVRSMSPEALVRLIAKTQEQGNKYRGEAAIRKVELQNSNRGVARLSARVQKQKDRIEELEAVVRAHVPDSHLLPENHKLRRDMYYGQDSGARMSSGSIEVVG